MTTTEQRLAALEAEVTELRQAIVFTASLHDAIEDRVYQRGRESILGRQAASQPRRPRHLQVAIGGQQ